MSIIWVCVYALCICVYQHHIQRLIQIVSCIIHWHWFTIIKQIQMFFFSFPFVRYHQNKYGLFCVYEAISASCLKIKHHTCMMHVWVCVTIYRQLSISRCHTRVDAIRYYIHVLNQLNLYSTAALSASSSHLIQWIY